MLGETNIKGSKHVLAVKDLAKSADYYRIKLGLTTVWYGEGWHFLKRGNFFVMLGECPDEKSAFHTNNHSYFAYVDVDNIDDLHKEYYNKHVDIISHLEDKSWDQREFGIRTIDGHRIMFGEEITKKSLVDNN